MMQRVYDNWPDDYAEFQPENYKHLYGWLLYKVGHIETADMDVVIRTERDKLIATKMARAYFSLMREREIHYMRLKPFKGGTRIIVSGSLDYASAGKRKYEAVRAAMYELIEVVLGVPIETLKRESKREAA